MNKTISNLIMLAVVCVGGYLVYTNFVENKSKSFLLSGKEVTISAKDIFDKVLRDETKALQELGGKRLIVSGKIVKKDCKNGDCNVHIYGEQYYGVMCTVPESDYIFEKKKIGYDVVLRCTYTGKMTRTSSAASALIVMLDCVL